MLDPSNIPPVGDEELLARYIVQSKSSRKDGTIKPDVFIPYKRQELSVTRHRETVEEELWGVGHNVALQRGKTLYGRVDIQAKDCQIESLQVEAHPVENNPNHANITGWPPSKPDQKELALKLAASKSISKLIPPPSL